MALPEEDLHCPIDFELPKEAVECSSCHNIFCQQCVSRQQFCPICKVTPGKFIPNIPVRRMVERIRVRCPNCNYVCARGELNIHAKYCKATLQMFENLLI